MKPDAEMLAVAEQKYAEGLAALVGVIGRSGYENIAEALQSYMEMMENLNPDRALLGACAALGLMAAIREAGKGQ